MGDDGSPADDDDEADDSDDDGTDDGVDDGDAGDDGDDSPAPADDGDDSTVDESGPGSPTGATWDGHPYPAAESESFTMGRSVHGIEFEPIVRIHGQHIPEGLAYHDGHIYTGERVETCTIREYTTDGEKTDREFYFEEYPGVSHTNTLTWHDGHLWVADSATSRTYIIDWGDEPELVNTFEQEDPYSGTWRMIFPTSDGTPKLVANHFRGENAWIFDLESTLEDGTWSGNVDRTIRNGFFTDPQTMEWHDGDLYTTTHDWIIKSSLPYADEIESGQQLIRPETIEYAWDLSVGSRLLEQMIYNPDDDEYFLCDRGDGGRIFRGVENDGPHRQRPWSGWPTEHVGDDDVPVLNADQVNHDPGLLRMTTGTGADKTGWVETWVYDTGSEEQDIEISYLSTDDVQFALEISANEEWGLSHYTFRNMASSEIVNSDIERVDGDWVKFGWEVQSNSVTPYIWRPDDGWQSVATVHGDHMGSQLAIRRSDGETLIGDWTVALE